MGAKGVSVSGCGRLRFLPALLPLLLIASIVLLGASRAAFATPYEPATGTDIRYRLVAASNSTLAVQLSADESGEVTPTLALRASRDAQYFTLQDNGNGTVAIVSVAYPGLALTAAQQDWGARITAAPFGPGASQQWRFDDVGNGALHVWLGTTSWLLDIDGISAQSGTGCVLWQDNGTAVQHWILERVDGSGSADPQPQVRYAVCIGDSFLAGYAPEGTQISWGQAVGDTIGYPTYRYADGGSGFSARGQKGYTFGTLADKAYQDHKSPSVVLVAGGYNDHMAGYSTSALRTAAAQFARKITSYWPDAEIFIFVNLWGNGQNTSLGNAHTPAADSRASAIKAGIESVGNSHIHVLSNCWTWIYTGVGLVSSDNVHPLSAGHAVIAAHMVDFIRSEYPAIGGGTGGAGTGEGGSSGSGGGEGSGGGATGDKYVWPEGGVTVSLDVGGLGDVGTRASVDGRSVPLVADGSGTASLTITTPGSKIITLYAYNTVSSDAHEVYPVHMYVWFLQFDTAAQAYSAVRIAALDDILQYAGSSIRMVGVKGIRMITGVPQATRSTLMGRGIVFGGKTWRLEEYGTVIAFDSDLGGADVTRDNTRFQNFAYSKTKGKDPIFSQGGGVIKFTNVLTGFSNDQCEDDIAMRPYLVLKAYDGETVTVYGGTVHRSIGYIAWQNRSAFSAGTAAYEYIWGIIGDVYGDAYGDGALG